MADMLVHVPNIEFKQDGGDETCATVIFEHEDHTLGNLLRYMLMRDPRVEFCGYSVPHPSENFVHVRIQTLKSTTAMEVRSRCLLPGWKGACVCLHMSFAGLIFYVVCDRARCEWLPHFL